MKITDARNKRNLDVSMVARFIIFPFVIPLAILLTSHLIISSFA